MQTISDADAALLGLLTERAMHPWEIEKVVQARDMRSWTDLSQSTIYKQLRSLEKAGLVDCRHEVDSGRLRRVYSLNDTGREALLARLREYLSHPQHIKWQFDLGVYNLHLLPKEEALAALAAYRAKLDEGIACYRRLDEYLSGCGCPAHRLAIARRPVYLLEGEIRWVDAFVSGLEEA